MADSTYYAILSAVKDGIVDIALPAINPNDIQLIKVENFRETVLPGLPGVLILPLGQETMPIQGGSVGRDYIGYPVAVVMLDSDRQDTGSGEPTEAMTGTQDQEHRYDIKLYWRQQIRKKFINQRLAVPSPSVSDVFTCHVEPQAVVEAADWLEDNIWVSTLVLRFFSRETRG